MSDPREIADELACLIRNSHASVLLSAGELLSDLYGRRTVLNAIKAALKRGVRFEVLVGPGVDRNTEVFKALKESILVLKHPPPLHFAVVDGTNVRIEDLVEHQGMLPPNKLARNVPRTAEMLTAFFNEVKTSSELLDETQQSAVTSSKKEKGTGESAEDG